jgi:hypothetical protein
MEQSNKKYIKTMDIDDKFHYLRTVLLQAKEKISTVTYQGSFLQDLILFIFIVDGKVSDSEYDLYYKLNKTLELPILSKEVVLQKASNKPYIKTLNTSITKSLKSSSPFKSSILPFLETIYYMGRVISKEEQAFLDSLS